MNDLSAITLVHDFRGSAAHWSKVILELKCLGHDNLYTIELLLASLTDGAERTRKMIVQQQGPVLLVGHSYGDAVITEIGNQPNVVGLVYITVFAPDNGESPGGIIQERSPLAVANLAPDSDGYLWVEADRFRESFCQNSATDKGLVMDITQKASLASTFGDAVGSLAWKSRSSQYQISSADRMTTPENQERMATRVAPRKIATLDASHASLTPRVKEVAALIDETAVTTAH